jgi:hypothetical protein
MRWLLDIRFRSSKIGFTTTVVLGRYSVTSALSRGEVTPTSLALLVYGEEKVCFRMTYKDLEHQGRLETE